MNFLALDHNLNLNRNLARLASPPASTHILRGEKARQARNRVPAMPSLCDKSD